MFSTTAPVQLISQKRRLGALRDHYAFLDEAQLEKLGQGFHVGKLGGNSRAADLDSDSVETLFDDKVDRSPIRLKSQLLKS